MGGFEGFVVGGEGGIKVGGADVELFREVGGASFAGAEGHAETHDEKECDEAADGDLDDERHGSGFFGRGGAVFLGDLIEVFQIIHSMIIA